MYNLCKINTSICNGSVLGHPLDVIYRSESLDKISTEMTKRICDGCPAKNFKVFIDVDFAVNYKVEYKDETDGHDQEN